MLAELVSLPLTDTHCIACKQPPCALCTMLGCCCADFAGVQLVGTLHASKHLLQQLLIHVRLAAKTDAVLQVYVSGRVRQSQAASNCVVCIDLCHTVSGSKLLFTSSLRHADR